MQVHLMEGLEDELAWLLQKAKQSHQGAAREPTPQAVDLSPQEWVQCLSWPWGTGSRKVSRQYPE